MRHVITVGLLCFAALIPLSFVARAAPVSSCAPDYSSCDIYEGQLLTYPVVVVAGDAIVDDSSGKTVDVFRVFNDLLDTGGGTGLGDSALLYGADIHNLPDPSTFSANAVTLTEGTGGPAGYYETDYLGNGTIYRLYTPTPEPSPFALLAVGLVAFVVLARRRAVSLH